MKLHGYKTDFLEPEQIEVVEKAYLRALEFVQQSGDAEGDENVCENMAMHSIVLGRSMSPMNMLRITNGAIERYRVQRAADRIRQARATRNATSKPANARAKRVPA